jgi:hypothetical protein
MKKSRWLPWLLLASASLAPLSARADTVAQHAHSDITITYNGELNRAHGVRSGTGTLRDPYVISGWTLNNINIRDTTRAITIINNTIAGTLTLDWVGPNITVMHNEVNDLRVNQNNARWGDPTSGHIMHNTFTTVGQLRHFDGMFSHNTVGTPTTDGLLSSYPQTRAVNFDGFNGAAFNYNTIYGYVDARLHGHHHASAFGEMSHMHADGPHDMPVDHTRRFHEITIDHNSIYTSAPYALAYLDTDHADNDRTANSETNPYLNAPHSHATRVRLIGNTLNGAGILVDVFNAVDSRHKAYRSGLMDIAWNRVNLIDDAASPFRALAGIEVRTARSFALRIRSNTINGSPPPVDLSAAPALASLTRLGTGPAILLHDLTGASVMISDDRIANKQIGVQALRLSSSVTWTIKNLRMDGVDNDVVYDSSVANPPRRA